jgi:hypothetical protein
VPLGRPAADRSCFIVVGQRGRRCRGSLQAQRQVAIVGPDCCAETRQNNGLRAPCATGINIAQQLSTTNMVVPGRVETMISLWWALLAFWAGGFAGVLLVALMLVSREAFGSGSTAD